MKISYGKTEEAWNFEQYISQTIDTKNNIVTVCDVGGGANPLLNPNYIAKAGLKYSVLDISEEELQKAPSNYSKIQADIASPNFQVQEKFDLVFSKMLAEHISNAEQFHKNIYNLLAEGGLAVHFFPTLYAFPFIVNRLLPERLGRKILNLLAPRDRYQHAKFPAYYRWCHGPTRRQITKFTNLGYSVVEYRGFFGHEGYYRKLAPLRALHLLKTQHL